MAKQRKIFCQGAMKQGVNIELANHIFDLMEKFAFYGFNKSHSASYALIAYRTAWLKAHYPAVFMAAVLSSDMDRTEKIMILLEECRALKLKVAAPDINQSDYFFKVQDDHHLMYGLGAIKGVGEAAIDNILATRQTYGNFTDLFDFCRRVDLRKVNRRALEALIKSGCFDTINKNRAALITSLSIAFQYAEQTLHNQRYGQQDLLGMHIIASPPSCEETRPWSDAIQLQGEKETLGFYLTGHPLRHYFKELKQFTTCHLAELKLPMPGKVRIAGIITQIRTRQTKRGDRIAIFTLDDESMQIEVVCFAECYQQHRAIIIEDQMIIAEGEIGLDDFNQTPRLICRELY